jgi:hypothetical protein
MVPLADQPGVIGFFVFTKAKRVEITLRSACGGVPKELRTLRLHHDRLIVVLGSVWVCQLPHAVSRQVRWPLGDKNVGR